MICKFNVNGTANLAHCYFKQIDGRIRDDFLIWSENRVYNFYKATGDGHSLGASISLLVFALIVCVFGNI